MEINLTMQDVVRRYTSETPHNNRIKCPLCSSRRQNMSFTSYGFYCWSCGRKGSVIQFAMDLFDIDFPTALRKLNDDFNLGLQIDRPPTKEERQRAERTRLLHESYRDCKELLGETLSEALNIAESNYDFYDNLLNTLKDSDNLDLLMDIGIKRYNNYLLIDDIKQIQYEVKRT